MFDRFWCQTHVAALYIGFDVFSQTRLIVFPVDQLFGFIDSKMVYKRVIIVPTDKLRADDF